MSKNPKYFIIFILLVTLIIVLYRYQQYIVSRNFTLEINTVCDAKTENCFVADCSIENDPECDTTTYKKVEILDNYAPKCLEEHACEAFSCDQIKDNCSITYCSSSTLEDGEKCAEPLINK